MADDMGLVGVRRRTARCSALLIRKYPGVRSTLCDSPLPGVPPRAKVVRDPSGEIECPNPICGATYRREG